MCAFCGGANNSAENVSKRSEKKEKARAAGDLENRRTEHTPRKCFICGSKDNLIEKCLKPPKENDKQRKQVSFNEKDNRACNNGKKQRPRYICIYGTYVW